MLDKHDHEIAALPALLAQEERGDAHNQPTTTRDGGTTAAGGATDAVITFDDLCLEPHLVVTKLALLVAVMQRCGMHHVRHQFAIGSCPGLLVHESYFPGASAPSQE